MITTPDRRIRVFVSSTLGELAEERRAARAAISELRLTPVMFELGARPHPPRELYRAYLAQSDVFVGIYGERYGWVAPGEPVSGLEDEYLLSGHRPKLIYVKEPAAAREPRLDELLDRIRVDDTASYKLFASPAELTGLLADDLAVLLTERFDEASRAAGGTAELRHAAMPVPPTGLVGRDAEATALVEALRRQDSRLVTLVGPGGIGKTRLALEVAARLAGDYDGVWFVDLAPITDPALVPARIASALGMRSEGTGSVLDVLLDRLAGEHVLLVLDNVEHLLPAAPDIGRLAAGCSRLSILATSRIVLRLRGEREFPLAPLATPSRDAGLDECAGSAAVRLFVDRARDVRPGFALTEENAAAVAELTRRLDGIPLAIELVAARVRLLPPAALLRRLSDRLDLRADLVDLPQRQRTLRATIDWSHSLLGTAERALLARLSVFAAGWTVEAAEAVGVVDGDLDTLEKLSSLVAQSLVVTDERPDVEPHFRMLDTIREYAGERLDERGDRDATMRRLAAYLRELSGRTGPLLDRPQNRYWLARLDAERDNMRAAMGWAVRADEAETVIRIAAPLSAYWWTRGLLAEMLVLADQTAALPSAARLPVDAQALLLWCLGISRIALGRVEEAAPYLSRLSDAAAALGDDRLRAHSLTSLALTVPYETGAARARAMLTEALELFRRTGDRWGVAFVLTPLGHLALRDGDPATATRMHQESLGVAEEIENDQLRGQALNQLAIDALMAGDVAAARSWLVTSAELHRELRYDEGSAYCLDCFAGVALGLRRPEAAVRLAGAAAHTREVVGVAVYPLLRPLADTLAAAVRNAVDAATFDREWRAGAAMRPGDALARAVELTAEPAAAPTR